MASDSLNFDIPGIQNDVNMIQSDIELLQNSKTSFQSYIESNLEPNWNTPGGKAAVKLLKEFVANDFQNYINYLSQKAENFEVNVIPRLDKINNA